MNNISKLLTISAFSIAVISGTQVGVNAQQASNCLKPVQFILDAGISAGKQKPKIKTGQKNLQKFVEQQFKKLSPAERADLANKIAKMNGLIKIEPDGAPVYDGDYFNANNNVSLLGTIDGTNFVKPVNIKSNIDISNNQVVNTLQVCAESDNIIYGKHITEGEKPLTQNSSAKIYELDNPQKITQNLKSTVDEQKLLQALPGELYVKSGSTDNINISTLVGNKWIWTGEIGTGLLFNLPGGGALEFKVGYYNNFNQKNGCAKENDDSNTSTKQNSTKDVTHNITNKWGIMVGMGCISNITDKVYLGVLGGFKYDNIGLSSVENSSNKDNSSKSNNNDGIDLHSWTPFVRVKGGYRFTDHMSLEVQIDVNGSGIYKEKNSNKKNNNNSSTAESNSNSELRNLDVSIPTNVTVGLNMRFIF